MTGTTTVAIRVNARVWMRALARDYADTRRALRVARTPELANALRCQLANVTYAWRLLRNHD